MIEKKWKIVIIGPQSGMNAMTDDIVKSILEQAATYFCGEFFAVAIKLSSTKNVTKVIPTAPEVAASEMQEYESNKNLFKKDLKDRVDGSVEE